MTTWIRPSGSEIELADTAEMLVFADEQGWTEKPKQPDLLSGDNDGDSGPSSESDTSGDTGSGDGS